MGNHARGMKVLWSRCVYRMKRVEQSTKEKIYCRSVGTWKKYLIRKLKNLKKL